MRILVFLLLALSVSGSAYANAGVPMLALAWPVQWLALVPIVLIETEVMRRMLGLRFRELLSSVAKANLKSTFVGIPLAWLGMLLIEMVVGGVIGALQYNHVALPKFAVHALYPLMTAWIFPSEWGVVFAYAVLAIPFCLISIRIERRYLWEALPNVKPSLIHLSTVRANVISYGLLSVLAFLYPLLGDGQ